MNNSSDSENINNNDNIDNTQKKRGRPRKNLFLDKSTKNSDKKEITNEEKDIILHLPVFMPKTKKEYESELDSESNDDTVLSISESEDESENDYKKLYKEQIAINNKKDIYIEKLKELKDGTKTSEIFDSDIQKDLIKHPIKLKLIDNNTMKIIEQHRTDICCWWCTYNFDTYACFIPEKFYNDTYYVFGCFCSFNCAASYNLSMNDYKVMERYALIKKLYNYNAEKRNKLAPPKEVLQKYGGIVTIESYRQNFITCDKNYRINLPPLVSLNHVIEEITIEKNENKDSHANIVDLKKKLPKVKNNLFNTMGIKNK